MQKAEKRLLVILKKAENSGISVEALSTLEITRTLCNSNRKKLKFWPLLMITSLFVLYCLYPLHTTQCFLDLPFEASKIFRPPEDCGICINVTEVDRVSSISPEDFENLYVSTARPVIVTDGTVGWDAIKLFSFDFFKSLYLNDNQKQQKRSECQFFPYKTTFDSLAEVFNMSVERSRLEPGTEHWYIGWSNCNDNAGKILRQYYREPYFLPETSENMALNWIFMGGPGSGAHMHVDDVLYPSWQAQIKGRKTWHLAPPPECLYKCKSLHVTVEPGEIIVIDTNRWYHKTHILPGSISITIGSEFD